MAYTMYAFSDKGHAPGVYLDQEWTENAIEGVRVWVSPDGLWVKVQQTMQWDFFIGRWPIAQQKMDRLARMHLAGARIQRDSVTGGNGLNSTWTRTYRVS